MRGSVKIVGHDWTLHLPTGSGYDREVLLDHLSEAVHTHGRARLIAPGGAVSVTRVGQKHPSCTRCGGAVRRMVGRSGRDRLCLGCVWRRALARVPRLRKLATTF
jgi:hypothetical protein